MSRIAVIFPGIGYHTDKPLLYYSAKLAASMGYEIIKIQYPPCPVNLKEADAAQIGFFVKECMKAVEKALNNIDLNGQEDILFVSKSIGTAVAAAYADKCGYSVRHIFFTPLVETFEHVKAGSGIAFNGTKDNWADSRTVIRLSGEKAIPITTIDDANHSLETGVVTADTEIICRVMKSVENYIKS